MDKLDQYIREKLEAIDYEAGPSQVDAMQAILVRRKRRRWLLIWWLPVMIIAGSSAAVIGYKLNSGDESGSLEAPAEFSNQENKPGTKTAASIHISEAKLNDAYEPGFEEGTVAPGKQQNEKGVASREERTPDHYARQMSNSSIEASEKDHNTLNAKQGNTAVTENPGFVNTDEMKMNPSTNYTELAGEVKVSDIIPEIRTKQVVTKLVPITLSSFPFQERSGSSMKAVNFSPVDPFPHEVMNINKVRYAATFNYQHLPDLSGINSLSNYTLQAGVQLDKPLSRRWYLFTGLGYEMRSGGLLFVKQGVQKHYGFRLRSVSNALEIKKVHLAYLKLGLGKQTGRFSFEAGLRPKYAIGAKGDLHYRENIGTEEEQGIALEDVWVVTTGLRKVPVDAELHIGFMPGKSSKISICASYGVLGIVDPVENSLEDGFTYYRKSRDFSIGLVAQYYLF